MAMNVSTTANSAGEPRPPIAEGTSARVSSFSAHEDGNTCHDKARLSNWSNVTGEATPADPRKIQTEHGTVTNRNISPPGRAHVDILQDTTALQPDLDITADFEVPDNKFAFIPSQMSMLFDPKSLSAFHAMGGIDGLERGLRTDRRSGLSSDEGLLSGRVSLEEAKGSRPASRGDTGPHPTEFDTPIMPIHTQRQDERFGDRRRIFGENRLPEKKSPNLFQLVRATYNDKVLILLTVAAVISLAVGLYQTFGQLHDEGEAAVEWIEGVAITVAILIVVIMGALNDWQKERQFAKLNKKKQDRSVKLIRSGLTHEVSVFSVLVGDVMHLEPGDLVPVDGIFIDGYGVRCDESSATGESDLVTKHAAASVYRAILAGNDLSKMDPFILSGSKILDRKPDQRATPLITITMWKIIIAQSIYKLAVLLIIHFGGEAIFSYHSESEEAQLRTMVFNTFVWMQIFNHYNNRRIDNKLNIFEGITRNWLFIFINLSMVAGQILIIMVGGRALQVVHLNGAQWGYSIVLGFLSIPVAIITRCVPDDVFLKIILRQWWSRIARHGKKVSDGGQLTDWDSALLKVRDEMELVPWVHGKRLQAHDWRSISHRKSGLKPMAVMAGLIAGSIGGWPRT